MTKNHLFLIIILFQFFAAYPIDASHYDKAVIFFKQKKYKQAIVHYKKAINADEDNIWIYNNIVYCFIYTKDYENALHYAESGYQRYPDKKVIKQTLGWALRTQAWDIYKKDLEQALYLFNRGMNVYPEDIHIVNGYGYCLALKNDKESILSSISILEQALHDKTGNDKTLRYLIKSFKKALTWYITHSKIEQGIILSDKMIKHFEDNHDTYSQIGIEYFMIQQNISSILKEYILQNVNLSFTQKEQFITLFKQKHPYNYFITHILGTLYYDAEQDQKAYDLRTEAYSQYLIFIEYMDDPVTIDVPLKGIMKHVKYNNPLPKTHNGFWINAIDYLLYDENKVNISENAPVFSPVDGTVIRIDNNSKDLGHVTMNMGNGLTIQLVHFKPNSITVKPGDKVTSGDMLGVLGKSAHLHLHIWNKYGVSVPIIYRQYKTSKKEVINNLIPAYGEYFYSP